MKVLLIANYAPDGQKSMLAFKRVLERELPKTGCDVRVLAPTSRVLAIPHARRWSKWLGYVDKFIVFIPALARHVRWADVVHVADHSNAMYVRWIRSKPNLVTCHDVIAVQAAKGMVEGWDVSWTGRQFQRLISRGLALTDLVACVSDMTRRELLALGLAEEQKVMTVTNGLNDDFSPVAADLAGRLIARFGLAPAQPYLLHVGLDLARKNRMAVIKAFVALQERAAAAGTQAMVERLVFVGPKLGAEQQQLLQARGLAERVIVLQGVSHEELRALYASATALLFPSLQEGFGWPVIEAQACACPVFTSDLPPMNEIGSEAAVFIDPNDPDAIAAAIEGAASKLGEMRRLGIENAARYSAGQMAANYVAAYCRAIAQRKATP
jgi:glycosyltransferase involved in cell wall biosynthesis